MKNKQYAITLVIQYQLSQSFIYISSLYHPPSPSIICIHLFNHFFYDDHLTMNCIQSLCIIMERTGHWVHLFHVIEFQEILRHISK